MRSRKSANDHVAEVARRRLELLSAELAATRDGAGQDPPSIPARDGCGELDLLPVAVLQDELPDPVEEDAGRVGPPARPGRHALRRAHGRSGPGAWFEDRLPASLQGRVRLGAGQLATVAVLVAAAMALLAWNTVRAADPGDLVPARSAVTGPAGPPASAGGASAVVPTAAPEPAPSPGSGPPDAGDEVVVDVAGKVRRPGIVTLPAGARVVDALEAAGGARRGVRLAALNLARVLVDGEQVLVGVPAAAGVAASAASAPGAATPAALVDLNTADQSLLETLPGIGPVTAQAILQWRAEHGTFSAVDELLEVSGIGEATLADLAPFVTV